VGFLAVSTADREHQRDHASAFQSRRGFSGRLDTPAPATLVPNPTRFNPVVGFLAVSTIKTDNSWPALARFQSRRGFSGRLDLMVASETAEADMFQSRRGFSGRLDPSGICPCSSAHFVSIPSWVFWPSRRRTDEIPGVPEGCFNPVVGFLAVSTAIQRYNTALVNQVSIPSWVFWPSRQGVEIRRAGV